MPCASRADRAAGGPADGEEAEKLGFVTALGAQLTLRWHALACRASLTLAPRASSLPSGGLVAASAGAIAVFGLGVLGVMGAAKGAASLLGALQQSLRRAFLRCGVLSAARRSFSGREAQRRSP